MKTLSIIPKEEIAANDLPAILHGHDTPDLQRRLHRFYLAIPEILEAFISRCHSKHTKRAYRQDMTAFLRFMGIVLADHGHRILSVGVPDMLAFRDKMLDQGLAPKTLNRRLASCSGFYKYLAGVAAEMRLPVNIGNPAHAQFVSRQVPLPRDETVALSRTRARQLTTLPQGDSVIACRDRAILMFYLYTGARLTSGCRLTVADVMDDEEGATVRLNEKGTKRRTIGLHFAAADAIREYKEKAGISAGPLFRPLAGSRGKKLAVRHFDPATMYRLILSYLTRLPSAVVDEIKADGGVAKRCIYSPHSLRATTATLLLSASVDIRKVQDLLGHRHVTTTQIYDKRRITAAESASHEVSI